jgi:hypothetical protein
VDPDLRAIAIDADVAGDGRELGQPAERGDVRAKARGDPFGVDAARIEREPGRDRIGARGREHVELARHDRHGERGLEEVGPDPRERVGGEHGGGAARGRAPERRDPQPVRDAAERVAAHRRARRDRDRELSRGPLARRDLVAGERRIDHAAERRRQLAAHDIDDRPDPRVRERASVGDDDHGRGRGDGVEHPRPRGGAPVPTAPAGHGGDQHPHAP